MAVVVAVLALVVAALAAIMGMMAFRMRDVFAAVSAAGNRSAGSGDVRRPGGSETVDSRTAEAAPVAKTRDLSDPDTRAITSAVADLAGDHPVDGRRDAAAVEHERQLAEREAQLAVREARAAELAAQLTERERAAAEARAEADRQAAELAAAAEAQEAERLAALERVAAMTAAEARAEIVRQQEHTAKRAAAIVVRDIEQQARDEADKRARSIVALAVQRVASEQTTESAVTVVQLPADDMKGRIIGREGRNIRSFEAVTGVNLIIDDTPESVLLSCFDPVRREVGRVALESLVQDGRIHPLRIEEAYDKALNEVDALCQRAAEQALVDVGVTDLDDTLVEYLGRLRYRTSYGQNVLKHLVETAHIAGTMAAELGLDVALVKRCAFLHDIGKALTHEVEGSHALVGADVARKHGESDAVVHAIEAHHNEVPPHSLEAVLTQASDSCSGGRPGARRESVESYVQRLHRIEEIAGARPGVAKVFAMQAGHEVRVMVQPEAVDDLGAQVIAREVAAQIQSELSYPGQIRVTVVRESRVSEVAH